MSEKEFLMSKLISELKYIQRQDGFISEDKMRSVAERYSLSVGEVYSTASFYSFLYLKPTGKNIIRVCKNMSCRLKGEEEILKILEDTLKIKVGQTTTDKRFTLLCSNCIGGCDKGPSMMINGQIYEDLRSSDIADILSRY